MKQKKDMIFLKKKVIISQVICIKCQNIFLSLEVKKIKLVWHLMKMTLYIALKTIKLVIESKVTPDFCGLNE